MSLAFLTKPIGGKKNADAADEEPKAPRGGGRAPSPGPIRGGASNVTVGGAPRVDLMPAEIRVKRAQLRTRRTLRLALGGVAIIVVAGCVASWLSATVAQTTLSAAQAQQQQLIAEQTKYSDVTSVQKSIALIEAGQKVGDSSEIDWQDYLTKLQATLPAGTTISTATVNSVTPMTALAQGTGPLQGSRVATIQFTVESPSLPSVPQLLDGLKTLPGFVDATPGSLAIVATGGYTVNIELHVGSQAFANRFDTAAAAANQKAIKASQDAATSQGGN